MICILGIGVGDRVHMHGGHVWECTKTTVRLLRTGVRERLLCSTAELGDTLNIPICPNDPRAIWGNMALVRIA